MKLFAILCVWVAVAGAAHADDKERPAWQLEPKPYDKLPNGKISIVESTTLPNQDDHYALENVGVLQPIAVTVVAEQAAQPLHAYFGKQRWDEKLHELDTGAKGRATFKTRTQGELRISVGGGAEPRAYFLVVWVGAEVQPEMKPAVTSMKHYEETHGTGTNIGAVAVAIVLLAALAAALFAIARRKRRSGAAAGVLAGIILAGSFAHASPPLAPSALDPSDMLNRMNEIRQEHAEETEHMNEMIGQGLDSSLELAQFGIDTIHNLQELQAAGEALTAPDATCIDLDSASAPEVPASCADGEACGQCFADAQAGLNRMRLNLERLRCTYSATQRYIRASLAFGDGASGIHGVIGLEWAHERAGIEEAAAHLDGTYDRKYADMMPNLRGALEAVGACEARYFNDHDWYNRFGFIYYSFMADRYKRAN